MRANEIIGHIQAFIDKNGGTETAQDAEYANTPHEVTQPIATIIAQGDDVNKPKHPSDIRTNAPSMYPNHQAKE